MEAAVKGDKTHEPYGILGLCLSLVGIGVLTVLVMAVMIGASLLAAYLLIGREKLGEALRALLQMSNADSPLVFGVSIILYIAIVIATLVFARWRGGADWRGLVAWWPALPRLKDKFIWLIAGTALVYSVGATSVLAHFYPKSETWFTVPSDKTALALLFVLAVLLAPVTEELLFRGWIYTSLRRQWGIWAALLISAALFGLAHYESTHLYALVVFPLGFALGAIRERTGSVKASMLFHACNNLIAVAAASLQMS